MEANYENNNDLTRIEKEVFEQIANERKNRNV